MSTQIRNDIARDVDIAVVAGLIGDPSRAAMLDALLGRAAMPAGELARRAGVTPQTASVHLARLVEGGLLVQRSQGRHRYYALAGAEVARALESLAAIAPPAPVRTLSRSLVAEHLRRGRMCYDHLAGQFGVALTQALLSSGVLVPAGDVYAVSEAGTATLARFGVDVAALRRQRRRFAYPCLDWSEREYHLGGALGAALAAQLVQRGWIRRAPTSRAVAVSDEGYTVLREAFGVTIAQ